MRHTLFLLLIVSACGGSGTPDAGDAPDASVPDASELDASLLDAGGTPRIAVLTAFPAELAAVLEHTTVTDTQMIGRHVYRIGTISGRPVVVTMTGIGLLNAAAITATVLDHFDVTGIVFSGVAGSRYRIGDVTVPDSWALADGSTFPVDPDWLTLSRALVGSPDVVFDTCTDVPSDPTMHVCLPFTPTIEVGGTGHSADMFSSPFPCLSDNDEVYGCDIGGPAPAPPMFTTPTDPDPPVAIDQETAAVARVAQMRGVRFIAFRAVSDGMGDPLMLPGYPGQFFTYYQLAAHNAAAAAAAFIGRL